MILMPPRLSQLPAPATRRTVSLPSNWHQLTSVQKTQLNPWGCHDTTQIRADNGQCLSGGYTIPQTNTEEEAPQPTPSPSNPTTVSLPSNWHQLTSVQKTQLNPWGCHDTTQIRADNGQCLSGGYTIPQTNTEEEAPQPTPSPSNPDDC